MSKKAMAAKPDKASRKLKSLQPQKISKKAHAEASVATKVEAPSTAGTAPAKQEGSLRKGKAGLDERQILLISKAIADPKRMTLLRMIARGNVNCADIKSSLGISAATLSHHMGELARSGLIEISRDGRFIHAALRKKTWKTYLGKLKSLTAF